MSLCREKIDVVLPTYNGGPYVQRQIESVLKLPDADCRLLVRDDGSTDRTPSLLRELAKQHPDRLVLVEDDHRRLGACGSFGRLLERVEADYVAFCDQDDVWLPGRLAEPLRCILAVERQFGRHTPALAHTDLTVVDENLRTIAPSFWSYNHLDPIRGSRLSRLLVQNVVTGCATMVNRALVERARPIPTVALMHDWWMALVASALGRIEVVARPTVLYRQHPSNCLGAARYDWRYVLDRAIECLRRGAVKQWRHTTQRQAAALLDRYAAELSPQYRETLSAYVGLDGAGFFDCRVQLLRYGILKTGPLRNLGWLLRA